MSEHAHIEFLFMDESGDLGKLGSKYFTVVVVLVHDAKALSRIIKRVRERKLKKKLRQLNEVKANNSNEAIRNYVLSEINKTSCSISALVVLKDKVKDDLFEHKDKLYNYLCGLLLEQITLNVDIVDITIDKRESNKILRDDFNQYIERKIKSKINGITVRIKHLESHASNELQAVDFVAWAVHRKFAQRDESYYNLVKSKIKNSGKEEIWQ